mmetsp:Transcript_12865/g.17226  ORF Transcript_12865/g.17226 Transcript_12865/m.17226 type:complete len:272 (+) Transcript_12865:2616-3431(+)
METYAGLPRRIKLFADGVEVPLPPDSQGIIFLNIDSYSGGLPLWSHGFKPKRRTLERRYSDGDCSVMSGINNMYTVPSNGKRRRNPSLDRIDSIEDFGRLEREERAKELSQEEKLARVTACDRPSSCQDGMLEVISLRGSLHLGQIFVGLSNADRLCQCKEATITLKKKVAVQFDGEPWRQDACTLKIKRKKDAAIMLHRATNEGGGVETEMAKLLDWAEERKVIDRNVHSVLMKEFSRRIEKKTQQRKFESQENLMQLMKQALVGENSYH